MSINRVWYSSSCRNRQHWPRLVTTGDLNLHFCARKGSHWRAVCWLHGVTWRSPSGGPSSVPRQGDPRTDRRSATKIWQGQSVSALPQLAVRLGGWSVVRIFPFNFVIAVQLPQPPYSQLYFLWFHSPQSENIKQKIPEVIFRTLSFACCCSELHDGIPCRPAPSCPGRESPFCLACLPCRCPCH